MRKTGQYSLSQSVVKIEKLSKEHQTFIKNLVMDRTKMLPKEHQAKAAITQWSALKTHFGKSYKNINDDQFVEAVSLLARLPLEGELIINEPSKSEDYYLTESEFCKVAWAVFSAKQQNQLLEKLIEPLNAIQSRLTSDVWDYAREYKSTWQNGMEIMSRLAENLEVDRHSPLNLQRIKQHLADNQRLI
ncbi:P22AR C-terminal domain-containing protein [Rodentibacter caecimuris]|uniref:P22AR C-terminal domain-containing protein n=1 Tax=Rodentibacter caecimuris TaxID=1796644 RepID=UPI003AF330BD